MKHKNNVISGYNSEINKGINYSNKGNFEKAEESFLKAININKLNHLAYINLSNIYVIEKKINKSTKILFDFLEKNGFHEKAIVQLAKICINFNLENEIIKLFNTYDLNKNKIEIKNRYLYFYQAYYYERKENIKKAIVAYKNSILCDRNLFIPLQMLLNLLEKNNDIKNFKKYLKTNSKNTYNQIENNILDYYKCVLLYREKKFKDSNELIHNTDLLKKLNMFEDIKIKLHDIQAKNYENLRDYQNAYINILIRNKIISNKKENNKFDKKIIINTIEKYKKFYRKDLIKNINEKLEYKSDKNLVFLVGFPRSGTTLLDTILRSHPNVQVLEEKPFLLNLRHNFFKKHNNNLEALKDITQVEKDSITSTYFKNIDFKNLNKNLIVDKFPLSIIEIGFIKCIFPKSKIILALRNPCDVVTSCLFSAFKMNDAMINFLKLEDTINFYNHVFSLFEIFEKEFDLELYKIKYEDLVYDFKNQMQLLLKFLNLEYKEEIENFHINAKNRRISTPSYNQVINPIYKSSIGRWKNYPEIINSTSKLNKWIEKFNY